MKPEIAPIDATLGAVVTGVNLARMDALAWKIVEQAFHDHGVLVFPAQGLTAELSEATAPGFARAAPELVLVSADATVTRS